MRLSTAIALTLLALAACRPPAADEYVARVALDRARGEAREPLASPDVDGAIWAGGGGPDRLLYGQPGKTPLLALACEGGGTLRTLRITRFAATDPEAKALMALIGNGHIARLKVDAEYTGKAWLWEGRYAPNDPQLDVLTGAREVEATIPGAGTLKLNPSPRPGELVERCRRLAAPAQALDAEQSSEPLPPT